MYNNIVIEKELIKEDYMSKARELGERFKLKEDELISKLTHTQKELDYLRNSYNKEIKSINTK